MVQVGQKVLFVDEMGVGRDALVTCVHGADYHREHGGQPTINLVICDPDEKQRDDYGRKIKRHSSVVPKERQTTNGMYWTE